MSNQSGDRNQACANSDAPKSGNTPKPDNFRNFRPKGYYIPPRARAVGNDSRKPEASFNPHGDRAQVTHSAYKNHFGSDDTSKSGNTPMLGNTFKLDNSLKVDSAPKDGDTHKDGNTPKTDNADKPGNAPAFNSNAYRKQVDQGASNSPAGETKFVPKLKKQKQSRNPHKGHKQATQKARPTENKANKIGESHFMTNAEVRQWFRETEENYEREKKVPMYQLSLNTRDSFTNLGLQAGKYDKYVPAGGQAPDISAFCKMFDPSNASGPGGLKNSIHAPKADEPAAKHGQGSQ